MASAQPTSPSEYEEEEEEGGGKAARFRRRDSGCPSVWIVSWAGPSPQTRHLGRDRPLLRRARPPRAYRLMEYLEAEAAHKQSKPIFYLMRRTPWELAASAFSVLL